MEVIFSQGGMALLRYDLDKPKVVVGRGSACDIMLMGSDISREHIEFKKSGKAWVVNTVSNKSAVINGKVLDEETLLTPGDRINIGSWKIEVSKVRHRKREVTNEVSINKTVKLENNEDTEGVSIPNIKVVVPPEPPHSFTLKKEITVGQHSDCRLSIDDPFVSSWHCTLSWNGHELILQDAGSTNGTFINGHKVKRSVLESDGEFTIGKSNIKYKVEKESKEVLKDDIIGSSSVWCDVITQAKQFAKSDVSICILGESGTGKEVIAKYIHENSSRKSNQFIAVNCGAIPSSLIESVLFGHEKGAFTGASDSSAGYFEQADGGTLFLDEVAEITPEMQTRLLRVLEEREVRRVGG